MPSETHQNLILLIQRHPELAVDLARRAGAPVPRGDGAIVDVGGEFDIPTALGHTIRTDLAVAELGRDDRPRWALTLEIQLSVDSDKEWSTPLYRAARRWLFRCPTWALVVSPAASVRAVFLGRMFALEPELRPLVVVPEMIDPITDLELATARYPWAALAAVFHAGSPNAVRITAIAIQALLRAAPADLPRYIQLVATSVGVDVMNQVKSQLPEADSEPLSEWERRGALFVMGKQEGLAEGLQQGLQQARAEQITALRAVVDEILHARGFDPDQVQPWLDQHRSADALRDAIRLAATVTSLDQLRPTDD